MRVEQLQRVAAEVHFALVDLPLIDNGHYGRHLAGAQHADALGPRDWREELTAPLLAARRQKTARAVGKLASSKTLASRQKIGLGRLAACWYALLHRLVLKRQFPARSTRGAQLWQAFVGYPPISTAAALDAIDAKTI